MLSTCWLIGAYFLAVSSHKHGRLNTSDYMVAKQHALCKINKLTNSEYFAKRN